MNRDDTAEPAGDTRLADLEIIGQTTFGVAVCVDNRLSTEEAIQQIERQIPSGVSTGWQLYPGSEKACALNKDRRHFAVRV